MHVDIMELALIREQWSASVDCTNCERCLEALGVMLRQLAGRVELRLETVRAREVHTNVEVQNGKV